jgi:flagellar hook assembly protein FlgD
LLKQAQAIDIDIYAINGQLVKSLLQSNTLSAGQYQITWDGTNQFNQLQTEGMYLYRIKSNQQVLKTGKLIFKK